jgi:hypothetical protein
VMWGLSGGNGKCGLAFVGFARAETGVGLVKLPDGVVILFE